MKGRGGGLDPFGARPIRGSIDPIRDALEDLRISRNDRLGSDRGKVKLKRKVPKPKKQDVASSTRSPPTSAAMFDDAEGDEDQLSKQSSQSPVPDPKPVTIQMFGIQQSSAALGDKKRPPSEISPSPVLPQKPLQQVSHSLASLSSTLKSSTTTSQGISQRLLPAVGEHTFATAPNAVDHLVPFQPYAYQLPRRELLTPASVGGVSDDATVNSGSSSTTAAHSLAETSTSSASSGKHSVTSSLSQATGLYTQPLYPTTQHPLPTYSAVAPAGTTATKPYSPVLYKPPLPQLMPSRPSPSPQVDASSSVPKALLAAWYSVQHKFQISKEQYVIWNNGAMSHVLKFTCLFVCPLTGEIFRAASYGDAVTFDDPQSKLVWFQKKAAAEHGAAAKAYDCFQFRRSLHDRDNDSRSLRSCRDEPAYLATGKEAEEEANLIQEILTKWTPPESRAKIHQLQDRVAARRRAAQGNP